jgi:Fe-S-cluster containining protein
MTVAIALRLFDQRHDLTFDVPARPIDWLWLLPQLQALTDRVVDVGAALAAQQGRAYTCRKGCGACCCQLVPISEVETYHVARLVKAMPKARREAVRERFTHNERLLAEAGLWPTLQDVDRLAKADYESFGMAYFGLGISCPFLEDGACSIHPHRPLACREYLVTSDPAACANPTREGIAGVLFPASVSRALRRSSRHYTASGWVPLAASLAWQTAHPYQAVARPGQELLRQLVSAMAENSPGVDPTLA